MKQEKRPSIRHSQLVTRMVNWFFTSATRGNRAKRRIFHWHTWIRRVWFMIFLKDLTLCYKEAGCSGRRGGLGRMIDISCCATHTRIAGSFGTRDTRKSTASSIWCFRRRTPLNERPPRSCTSFGCTGERERSSHRPQFARTEDLLKPTAVSARGASPTNGHPRRGNRNHAVDRG